MTDCIFCKIIAGEIPSSKIYEDDHTYAFLDISPANKGHTLVIPKEHGAALTDLSEQALGPLMQAIQRVAKAVVETTGAQGFNVVQNNSAVAGQVVFHVHFHIIPRFVDDGQDFSFKSHAEYDEGEMEDMKNSIIEKL